MSTEESFNVFNYTAKSCESCCTAMDHIPTLSTSDAESSRICCEQCQWMCWPFIFVFDILSCPVRLCCYYKNKK